MAASQIFQNRFAWCAVVYGVLVIAIWYGALRSPPKRDYVATSELAMNHRIVAGDLKLPDDFAGGLGFYLPNRDAAVGKYVTQPIIKATSTEPRSLVSATLGERPRLTGANSGDYLFSVVLAPDNPLAILIDVGASVLLAGPDKDKKQVAVDATVQAILCMPSKTEKKCSAVLSVAGADRDRVRDNVSALQLHYQRSK